MLPTLTYLTQASGAQRTLTHMWDVLDGVCQGKYRWTKDKLLWNQYQLCFKCLIMLTYISNHAGLSRRPGTACPFGICSYKPPLIWCKIWNMDALLLIFGVYESHQSLTWTIWQILYFMSRSITEAWKESGNVPAWKLCSLEIVWLVLYLWTVSYMHI